jgi:lathosterol oxidase
MSMSKIQDAAEKVTPKVATSEVKKKKKTWHYTPPLPLKVSPYFSFPSSPLAWLKWFIKGWFPVSEKTIVLILSIVSWAYFHPELERCRDFALDWIAQIYLRNLVLMILVAGGLHCYFYIWKKQGDERHYDARPLARNNRMFTFNSQILDNMFWTLASGVTIWSAYEILMMWAMANGHLATLLPDDNGWLILLILLIPIWETLYFFLIHKLIHWPPLYRSVHYLHHRNINVGPWSGLSMHPVEHLLYFGSILIHFVVPSSPLLIIFHLQYYALTAATTHTGFQGLNVGNKMPLGLGTFHHQLHHRYFECNYGGLEVPLDQWTGNFHDGTDASHQQFIQRRKEKNHA